MRKGYWAILIIAVLGASCGNKKQAEINDSQGFQIDTVAPGGVQRMQVSDSRTNVKFRGKEYHISIHRMPADSLPHVKDQAGGSFVDNEITLLITRDNGEKVVSKTFTKKSFASVVDADFLANSILEGMVYDKTSDNGIVLAASISYPQTDLYVPLSVTITPDGKMSFAKEEILEDNYVGEDSLN